MTIEQLENKIEAELIFVLNSGNRKEIAIINLKQIAIDYAEQFKYDYSKDCQCETNTGETWCCNQCGLPTTMKEVETYNDIDDKPEPIDDDAWLIY